MFLLILYALLSFVLSFGLVALIQSRLRKHLLDIPNHRSAHHTPVPRGGGLGFIVAFTVSSAIFLFTNPSALPPLQMSSLVLAGGLLVPLIAVGILDDYRGLPARLRYLVQLMVATVSTLIFGVFPQPWLTHQGFAGAMLALVLTVIGMTALINFYNFMDGLDGLVAGVAAIQFVFFAIELQQPLFLLLSAALAGFLVWNWSPATIFMGDAGSTALGALVAIALLMIPETVHPIWSWAYLTITLPITADTIYTLFRRLFRRENLFQAHRSHIFQRLYQSGWSHARVAIAYIGLTAVLALNLIFFPVVSAALVNLMLVAILVFVAEFFCEAP